MRKIFMLCAIFLALTACGGGGDAPPSTEAVWDQSNWDEKNWQ